MSATTTSPAWRALAEHAGQMKDVQLRELFAADPDRFRRFSIRFEDVLLDFSKNRITAETFGLLLDLARAAGLEAWRERLLTGEKINATEGRAVLHTALRNRSGTPIKVDGQDVMPGIQDVLDRIERFTDSVRSGAWRGWTGQRITDVVNIGIGGSDLGPRMVARALEPFADKWRSFDPQLFGALKSIPAQPKRADLFRVEQEGIIPGAAFFNDITRIGKMERATWHANAMKATADVDLAFFDPDKRAERRVVSEGAEG